MAWNTQNYQHIAILDLFQAGIPAALHVVKSFSVFIDPDFESLCAKELFCLNALLELTPYVSEWRSFWPRKNIQASAGDHYAKFSTYRHEVVRDSLGEMRCWREASALRTRFISLICSTMLPSRRNFIKKNIARRATELQTWSAPNLPEAEAYARIRVTKNEGRQ